MTVLLLHLYAQNDQHDSVICNPSFQCDALIWSVFIKVLLTESGCDFYFDNK